jgi:hypothetical protein
MSNENDVVPAQAAARRALCLAALCYRARVETAMVQKNARYEGSDADFSRRFQPVANKVNDWLRAEQLWDALSNSEQAILNTRVGDVAQQKLVDATWRAEALAALLWALAVVHRLPAYDKSFDFEAALKAMSFWKDTGKFVNNARLRSSAELLKARDAAELWHWRARTYQIQREPGRDRSPAGNTYVETVSEVAARGQAEGLFVAIDADIPVFGKAYVDATEEEWRQLRSIASERHYGLNWLCGTGDDWDRVMTDT